MLPMSRKVGLKAFTTKIIMQSNIADSGLTQPCGTSNPQTKTASRVAIVAALIVVRATAGACAGARNAVATLVA